MHLAGISHLDSSRNPLALHSWIARRPQAYKRHYFHYLELSGDKWASSLKKKVIALFVKT